MQEQVLSIVENVTKINREQIDMEKDFVAQGVDSLDMFDILFKLQEEFEIQISEESIANNEWTSVKKIISKMEEMH